MEPVKTKDFFNPDCDPKGCGNYEKKCTKCELTLGTVGIYEAHLNKVHEMEPMEICDEYSTGETKILIFTNSKLAQS